jgi:hypothetical protein
MGPSGFSLCRHVYSPPTMRVRWISRSADVPSENRFPPM